MKTRTLIATLAVPATALGLFAQESVMITGGQKGPGDGIVIAQGQVGVAGLSGAPGNFRFFTQEFSFSGRTVTGAPYSADEKTESIQTLADGTRITNTTTTRVYRDSQGRTRTEMSLPRFAGDVKSRIMITISDPVAGVSYSLDPENKVAHQGMAMAAEARMKGNIQIRDTTTRAVAQDDVISEARITRRDMGMRAATKHEDLGANVIEGVSATGSRDTSTIEAGAMGNDRAITITSERWVSPELQIELKSVHNDPRMGQTTHTVANINRAEPDASLFQVPSDYKLEEGKPGPNLRYEFHQ